LILRVQTEIRCRRHKESNVDRKPAEVKSSAGSREPGAKELEGRPESDLDLATDLHYGMFGQINEIANVCGIAL
jgi:hypothetical protein